MYLDGLECAFDTLNFFVHYFKSFFKINLDELVILEVNMIHIASIFN